MDNHQTRPLAGRIALVTGASRRIGIGFAVAKQLASLGSDVFVHTYRGFDAEMPWGADPEGTDPMLAELLEFGGRVGSLDLDLGEPTAAERLIEAVNRELGHIDILILNHSRGVSESIEEVTADEIDAHCRVNIRANLLLIRAFLRQHDARSGGRIVTLTSGQSLVPMPTEIPYIATKGAIEGLTLTLSKHLASRRITLNCVDPGATDTGYATGDEYEAVCRTNPQGRWGSPQDAARLVGWLVTDDAEWITGQVIHSTGGS